VIVIKRFIFIIALLLSQASFATPDYGRQQQALNQIIQLTTLDAQITQLPGKVHDVLQQLATADNQQRISRIQAAFIPPLLRQALRRQINLNMLTPRYELLLNRLEAPELHRLLQMEQDAMGIVAHYERPIFIQHAQRRPIPKARRELIEALDEATGYSTVQIRTGLLLRQQLQTLVNPAPHDEITPHALPRAELDDPALRQQQLLSLLYTYRNASEEELQAYVDFYRSYQGQHFIKTFNGAWLAAINDVMRDIAWQLKHP